MLDITASLFYNGYQVKSHKKFCVLPELMIHLTVVNCQAYSVRGGSHLSVSVLLTLAQQIGFSHYGEVNLSALVPDPAVRAMCASDKCKMYGRSWSCPPACGSLEGLAQRLSRCSQGILVQSTTVMEDEFDLAAIRQGEELHKRRFDTLARQAKQLYPHCLPLAAGTCTRCKKCTYPDRPCRYPDRLYPSMEACGLLVSRVCEASGLHYYYGPKTMTYTACILLSASAE
jgi:predicted metal-binding protein